MTYPASLMSYDTTERVSEVRTGRLTYVAHFTETRIKVERQTLTRTSSSVSLVEYKETVYKLYLDRRT
jgi:hypothetical protein